MAGAGCSGLIQVLLHHWMVSNSVRKTTAAGRILWFAKAQLRLIFAALKMAHSY